MRVIGVLSQHVSRTSTRGGYQILPRDIEDISFGNSDLDDMLAAATARHGRVMNPNSQPEKGSFYRADQFEFSKLGVPSLYLSSRPKDFIGKPVDYG